MAKQDLANSTALNGKGFNQRLLSALVNGSADQEKIVAEAVKKTIADVKQADARWQAVRQGSVPLTFKELISVLEAFHQNSILLDTKKITEVAPKTPLSQPGFYKSLGEHYEDTQALKEQVRLLRDESKREKGFLKKGFNIFASKVPLEKIVADVASFERYCRKNNISFNEVNQQLVAGKKPTPVWDKTKEFRFLIAATGGVGLGAMGVNLTDYPGFAQAPGVFFGALPYVALPFISLNIFRAFSQKSLLQEAGTFARFTGMMATGFLISLGVASAMAGYLPTIDMSTLKDTVQSGADAVQSFSPSQYILHGIALAAGMAGVYKLAKSRIKAGAEQLAGEQSRLRQAFNSAASRIAPGIVKIGDWANKGADYMDKGFGHFMNYVGLPAILAVTSSSIATLGVEVLGKYAGLYATITVGFAAAAGTLATAAYLYGARKKEFKEIFKTASTAFGISSSMATMPVTKECLKKMGVSAQTRNSVVPLGANFNMMGTSLYLGACAAGASVMFGQDPSLMDRATVMGLCILTAFGAPGAPASTVVFLEPVLNKMGLSPAMAARMYEIIMPIDRPADMAQTSLNVSGDMVVAMGKDLRFKKARLANIKRIRAEREARETAELNPATNDNNPAPATAAAETVPAPVAVRRSPKM